MRLDPAGTPKKIEIRGARFYAPGAEDLSFNSTGACRKCDGTGTVRTDYDR